MLLSGLQWADCVWKLVRSDVWFLVWKSPNRDRINQGFTDPRWHDVCKPSAGEHKLKQPQKLNSQRRRGPTQTSHSHLALSLLPFLPAHLCFTRRLYQLPSGNVNMQKLYTVFAVYTQTLNFECRTEQFLLFPTTITTLLCSKYTFFFLQPLVEGRPLFVFLNIVPAHWFRPGL